MRTNSSELNSIKRLLEIIDIRRRHAIESSTASGELFNIFRILRVGHYEVRTHSPILRALLDPKGPHGQGSIFLQHFIHQLSMPEFSADGATVELEQSAGPMTDETGGRIDILLQDQQGRQIIIENKIYAVDQHNQMGRYAKSYPHAQLIYLSLYKTADKQIQCSSRFRHIDYASDIIEWLKNCLREVHSVPIVRETITQYIHLLQDLTNQNTNACMNQEIARTVLTDRNTYEAFVTLCRATQTIETEIFSKLKADLTQASMKLGLSPEFSSQNLSEKDSSLYFTSPDLDSHRVKISFHFNQSGRKGCVFGFSRLKSREKCPIEDQLFKAFKDRFHTAGLSPDWWVVLSPWDQRSQWVEDTLLEIQFGSFHNEIMEKVKSMLDAFCAAKTAAMIRIR